MYTRIVKALKEHDQKSLGALLNSPDCTSEVLHQTNDRGESLLHLACKARNFRLVCWLLEKTSIDPNQPSSHDETAMSIAAQKGDEIIITRLLLDERLVLNGRPSEDVSALHRACYRDDLPTARKLLHASQLKLRFLDPHHRTPLIMAIFGGSMRVARYLIGQEADVNEADLDGWTPLRIACEKGDHHLVKWLVEHCPQINVNQPDHVGRTPLSVICGKGDLALAEYLLRHVRNIDINQADKEGRTALHVACKKKHHRLVKWLITHCPKINVNQRDRQGRTPLSIVCGVGDHALVEYLLKHVGQMNVNLPDKEGRTPLHVACEKEDHEVVKCLVAHGRKIRINQPDKTGWTALHLACQHLNQTIIRYLLDHRADINKPNGEKATPFHLICQSGHLELVRLLAMYGAQLERIDEDGWIPFHIACQNGHRDVAALLLEAGIQIDSVSRGGWTALHLTCRSGHQDVVEWLLDRGMYINQPSKTGWTPLHIASQQGHHEITQILLKRGAMMDLVNKQGWTPLHLATQKGHLAIAKTLLDGGASTNQRGDHGYAPLHTACAGGHVKLVILLLERGAHVDQATWQAWTPLHVACRHGRWKVAEVLLQRGAKKDHVAAHGQTPLSLACRFGREKVIKVLLDNGVRLDDSDTLVHAIRLAVLDDHLSVVKLMLRRAARASTVTATSASSPLPGEVESIEEKRQPDKATATRSSVSPTKRHGLKYQTCYDLIHQWMVGREGRSEQSSWEKKVPVTIKDARGILDFRRRVAHYGMKLEEVPGDGNCFFHAVLHQLQTRHHPAYARLMTLLGCRDVSHATLRQLAVGALRLLHQQNELDHYRDDIDSYVVDQARDRTWADSLVISATARVLGVKLVLINSSGDPLTIIDGGGDHALYLGYEVRRHFHPVSGEPNRLFRAQIDRISRTASHIEKEPLDLRMALSMGRITGSEKSTSLQASRALAPSLLGKRKMSHDATRVHTKRQREDKGASDAEQPSSSKDRPR